MCPCLSSSIIKTSESPWLRRFFGTVGWQIPWGEHRCSPRSTSSPSSSGLSQEQDKSNPRGPCARYLGWFWGVIWRPDSGVGAGRGCRLQACSFEISTSGLSVCMPPAWGCEGVQAAGTLAGDFGHWGMQAVKDVAQGDTGTEGHGCWGTWCRGMFCCETRAPRGTVTGRHEHWGKWHRGLLHWGTRALKADTEAEGSDGRGGRGRETRSPSTRSASRPSRQAARHGGAEQSRAEQAHGGQHGGGHGGGHVSRAAPLATAAAAPQRGTARPARRPHRVLQLRHQRGGVPRPAGARGRAGSGLRSSRSGARALELALTRGRPSLAGHSPGGVGAEGQPRGAHRGGGRHLAARGAQGDAVPGGEGVPGRVPGAAQHLPRAADGEPLRSRVCCLTSATASELRLLGKRFWELRPAVGLLLDVLTAKAFRCVELCVLCSYFLLPPCRTSVVFLLLSGGCWAQSASAGGPARKSPSSHRPLGFKALLFSCRNLGPEAAWLWSQSHKFLLFILSAH